MPPRPGRAGQRPSAGTAVRRGAGTTVTGAAARGRLAHALRRRRRLRTGLAQLAYVGAGFALAVAMAAIQIGPQIDEGRFGPVLVAVAGGLISFIALVFSLLFLVVQYGNTALSPRLNLFRDSPLIWHAFGIYVGVFVFCATSAVALSGRAAVTLLVPVTTVLLVVLSLAVMRRLQMNAFRSLQLGGALDDISHLGRAILVALHDAPAGTPEIHVPEQVEVPPVATTLHWTGTAAILRQIDVPRLLDAAIDEDVVVVIAVRVGDALIERRPVLVIHGHVAHADPRRFLRHLETGTDRTFDQDPLLAFRLLSDIALRALSPAINDPATAVQALDHAESLLAHVVDADLGPRPIAGADGHTRVVVRLPTWEDYLEVAVDQIAVAARGTPSVERRLEELLEHLREIAPGPRAAALDRRRARGSP